MTDSIFTRIIKGEIPCHKIYEDDYTLAFLDIHPVQPGHTLIVPKTQIEFIWDLTDETYTNTMLVAKKVSKRLKDVLRAPYIGMQVVGVDVPHAHIHLIPFSIVDEFRSIPDTSVEPDHNELAMLSKRLVF